MKTLILVRHAKSSWDDSALPDKDRPLGDRGKRDAPKMGKRLAKRDVKPDLILSSPARRALTTGGDHRREDHLAAHGPEPVVCPRLTIFPRAVILIGTVTAITR